jgi:hypothetical protein
MVAIGFTILNVLVSVEFDRQYVVGGVPMLVALKRLREEPESPPGTPFTGEIAKAMPSPPCIPGWGIIAKAKEVEKDMTSPLEFLNLIGCE